MSAGHEITCSGAPPLEPPQDVNAAEAGTVREIIAFHRGVIAGVEKDIKAEPFDALDREVQALAREIQKTHARYIETLEMLLSFLE